LGIELKKLSPLFFNEKRRAATWNTKIQSTTWTNGSGDNTKQPLLQATSSAKHGLNSKNACYISVHGLSLKHDVSKLNAEENI
jgi:hypothetical protein